MVIKRKAKKPKGHQEDPCRASCSGSSAVPDEDRNCPTAMLDGGYREKGRAGRTADHPCKSGTDQYVQEVLGCRNVRKTALLLSLEQTPTRC